MEELEGPFGEGDLKKGEKRPSGGHSPPCESRWPHFEAMMLICDSVQHRGVSEQN